MRWIFILLASSLLAGAQVPAERIAAIMSQGSLNQGLVAWWKFNEGSGVTAFDSTSNGVNGGLTNYQAGSLPAWVTGKKGNALQFDGVSAWVSLPTSVNVPITSALSGGTQVTIAAWFKGTSVQSIVRLQPNGGANYIILAWGTSTIKAIISTDGGTTTGVTYGSNVQDNQWHHLVLTWQKNTVNGYTVYVDGQVSGQRDSANADLPTITGPLYLGCQNGVSEFTNGIVDDVRIYSRALSALEVVKLYKIGNVFSPAP